MFASRHYIPLKHLRAVLRLGQLSRYAAEKRHNNFIQLIPMQKILFCLVAALHVSPAFSQEVIGVEEVEPHVQILMKRENGSVYASRLDLLDTGRTITPPSLQFFRNSKLLEQADLSKTQMAEFEQLKLEYQNEFVKMTREFNDAIARSDGRNARLELAKNFLGSLTSLQKQTAERLETELIPFQSTIIKKFKFKQLSHLSLYQILLRNPFKTEFNIDKKQSEEIKRIAGDTEKKIAEFIKQARRKADAKVKSILDKEQLGHLKKLSENER